MSSTEPQDGEGADESWTSMSPDAFFQADLATFLWSAQQVPGSEHTAVAEQAAVAEQTEVGTQTAVGTQAAVAALHSDQSGPPPYVVSPAPPAPPAAPVPPMPPVPPIGATPPIRGAAAPDRSSRGPLPRPAMYAAAAIVIAGLGIFGATQLLGSDAGDTTTNASSNKASASATTTSAGRAGSDSATVATRQNERTSTTLVDVSTTTAAAPTTTTAPTAVQGTSIENTEQRSVYRDGKIYLEGRVQNESLAAEYHAKAVAVLGAANVVNNYVIDPTVQIGYNGTVEVDIPFVFATGSSVISGTYDKDLGIAIAGMAANPSARMIIVGHTDSIGDPARNLTLSQQRAGAVRDYMVSRGSLDPSRFDVSGVGDTQPVADNATPEGRAANRRIVVKITNILI